MYNKKRLFLLKITALILFIISIFAVLFTSYDASAKTEEEIEPYGLFTKLNLDIGGQDSKVFARVKNKFTLGNSTIVVYVYLYSSVAYEEDYRLMSLESYNFTPDLDQGNTLEAWANTVGAQKYWRAVMRYKFDNDDWVEKQTATILFSGKGEALS